MEQGNPDSQLAQSQSQPVGSNSTTAQLGNNEQNSNQSQNKNQSQPDTSSLPVTHDNNQSNTDAAPAQTTSASNPDPTGTIPRPDIDFLSLPDFTQIAQYQTDTTGGEQEPNSSAGPETSTSQDPQEASHLQPIKPKKATKRALDESDAEASLAKGGPGGKVRALRTAQSEMAKVERAFTEEQFLRQKDPSAERAARKTIKLKRAAERAELRAQMEAIQQNRYRPVYYYQPPTQIAIQDATAEATTFNGRFRKIVPKDPGLYQQQL